MAASSNRNEIKGNEDENEERMRREMEIKYAEAKRDLVNKEVYLEAAKMNFRLAKESKAEVKKQLETELKNLKEVEKHNNVMKNIINKAIISYQNELSATSTESRITRGQSRSYYYSLIEIEREKLETREQETKKNEAEQSGIQDKIKNLYKDEEKAVTEAEIELNKSIKVIEKLKSKANHLDEKDPGKKLELYLLSCNCGEINSYRSTPNYFFINPEHSSEIRLEILQNILDNNPDLKCPETLNGKPFLSFILDSKATPWYKLCEIVNYLLERDKIQPTLETIKYAHEIHQKFKNPDAKLLTVQLIHSLLNYAEPKVKQEFLNQYPQYLTEKRNYTLGS